MAPKEMIDYARRLCETMKIKPSEGGNEAQALILSALIRSISTSPEHIERLADALQADYDRIMAGGFGYSRIAIDESGFVGIIRREGSK